MDNSQGVRWSILIVSILALFLLVDSPVEGSRFFHERYKGLLVGGLILGAAFFHLLLGHRDRVFGRNCRLLLVFGMMFGQLALMKVLQHWLISYLEIPAAQVGLFLPMAIAPLVLSVMLGQRAGIFATIYGSLLGALVMNASEPYLYIILMMVTGLTAVALVGRVRKRGRLIQAGLCIGVVHLILAWAFGLASPIQWLPDGAGVDWVGGLTQALTILGVELFVATLISGMLPVLESFFGITTEISWIELADLNNPLLKRLTIEAPGTYHHSLLVGTLAENAAERIGANATMARVCSYFHDIGKLTSPDYFIENQGEGINPHDDLTPHMSAKMILSHVPDGVALAVRHRLNPRIMDVIREHHGTSLVYIFYKRAMQMRETQLKEVEDGMRAEEDVVSVDEADFRYKGPLPVTKESVIISLADAAESARRSLSSNDVKEISELVDRLVEERIKDGQLDEADITMEELSTIKKSFVSDLKNMSHSRPSYRGEGTKEGAAVATPDGDKKPDVV
ncbi:HD family phosphohydrolase [Sulfuriroseicoccus oceanibius]|uniref:HDIG domain-containing protein n=1 Tax=Sulfuriroseicoccus oceanibius TaxID=2707525 RepID=A0A6B3L8D6_9BACT|nr:HDIG domain-containing metalloprotein [Sulfuriroseicoccus oceanibius]QQL43695.1 HDIG domain-containing protein [Sulfuriroseicoccus oceanibius]